MLIIAMKVLRNWYLYPLTYFKFIQKPSIEFITKDGLKLKIRLEDGSSDFHVFTEIFLNKVYVKRNISEKPTIIDIGSHVGFFSLFCFKKFPNCKIFSYEPNEKNYLSQLENLKNNNCNINVYDFIVSGKRGNTKLFLDKDFAGHSIFQKEDEYGHTVKKSIMLEDIFTENKINKCDLLKMDCEGAEYEILMNSPDTILEKILNISIEVENNIKTKYPINKMIKKLQACGFQIDIQNTISNSCFLYAKKM